MPMEAIAAILVLLVVIYFFSRLGIKLADSSFNEPFLPWVITIVSMLFGWSTINEAKNIIGFIGFIPIIVYIVFRIVNSIDFDYQTKKKTKAILFSGFASAATYTITHIFFGFGIPEASLSAIVAAGILGTLGYSA